MFHIGFSHKLVKRSAVKGLVSVIVLITVYFTVLAAISGWSFARDQFRQYWFYIISLSLGFGLQFSLYSYLKSTVRDRLNTGRVLMATGATSSTAMLSCCAHYLTNLLPVLGVAGLVTFISQYQIQFFWVGIFFNIWGIIYMMKKVFTVI